MRFRFRESNTGERRDFLEDEIDSHSNNCIAGQEQITRLGKKNRTQENMFPWGKINRWFDLFE